MVSSCASCPIQWVLVFTRWKVWESLKTLNCKIMLLFNSLCIRYGYVLFVWIRSHLIVLGCISFFIWASYVVLDSVLLVQSSVAVPHTAAAASTCVHDLSYASRIYFLDTVCSTSQRHECRGSPNFHFTKVWILASYAKLRIKFSIHIFRGGSTPMAREKKISVIHFISFVSSNWVVINHQRGEDCKCNQALMWVLVLMTT